MAFPPLFLVVDNKNTGQAARANRFSNGLHNRDDLWKVSLVSGYIPGESTNFFFESEAEAGHFPKWQIFDPAKILQASNPNRAYIAGDVVSYPAQGLDQYTGGFTKFPVWTVQMADPVARNFLDLTFPQEREARQFGKGRAYKLQDVFGTKRALPHDISHALRQKADQARAAQLALQQLQAQGANVKTQAAAELQAAQDVTRARTADSEAAADEAATTTAPSSTAESADVAAAKAASARAQAAASDAGALASIYPSNAKIAASYAAALAAAKDAAHWALLALAYLSRPSSIYLDAAHSQTPTAVGATAVYMIVNGGASGWYKTGGLAAHLLADNQISVAELTAAGLAYVAGGNWTHPYNGFLTGVYVNENQSGGPVGSGSSNVGLY